MLRISGAQGRGRVEMHDILVDRISDKHVMWAPPRDLNPHVLREDPEHANIQYFLVFSVGREVVHCRAWCLCFLENVRQPHL